MKRGTLIRALFVLGLLATAAVLVLRSAWAGQKLCGELERRVPELAPGVKLQIASCRVEPLELGVDLLGVKLALPNQPAPTVAAERAEVRLSLLQALWGSVRLDRVTLDKPVVNLDLTHLPDAPPPKPRTGRCDLAVALQQVDIARLAIDDAAIRLVLPGDRSLELADLSVTAHTRRGVSALRVSEAGGKLEFPGGVLPLEKVDLAAQLDAPSADLEVQRAQIQAGLLSLIAHGSVHDLCDPDLNVEANAGVPLDLIVALAQPEGVKAQGYVTVNATVTGKPDAPVAHAEVDVTDLDVDIGTNNLKPKELSASLDVDSDKIEITRVIWPFPDGSAKAKATITRKGNWPITVSAEGKNVPFGELMNRLPLKHTWVDMLGAVKTNLTGHVLPSLALSGAANIDLADFHVRTRPWDSPALKDDEVLQIKRAHVDTDVNITPERVKLTHAKITTEKGGLATVDALLHTDPKLGLDVTGQIERFDLAEFGPIVGLPWSGVGSATNVHITGPYGEQVIDGNLSVKDFSFASVHPGDLSGTVHFDPSMVLQGTNLVATKGKTTYRARGLLDFGARGQPLAAGTLSLEGGRLEDLLDVLHDVHWSFEMFHGEATGTVSGEIALRKGPVLAPTSDIHLELADLVVYGRPLGAGDFHMRSEDGEKIIVPDVTLRGATGTFVIGGEQQMGGKLNYHLRADGVPMAVAVAPELTDWDMTGTLSGSATIGGTQQQAEIRGEVFGQDLGMFGFPAGQGHVQIVGIGNSMQITGPVGDDVTMWSRMRWENDFPVQARFTFEVPELSKYVPKRPEWSDVSGQLEGTLALEGKMKGPDGYGGRYVFPKVVFTKGDYTEENAEPVRLDFDGDRYQLQSFAFRGHGPGGSNAQATEFSMTGTRSGEEQALDLRLKGSLDAKLIETFVPSLDSSSGHVEVSAHLLGTQDAPEVTGAMELTNGRFKLRELPIALDDLNGTLQFSQSLVEVSELDGILNGGPFRLLGSVGLSHFRPSSYELNAFLDHSKWNIANFPQTTLSGALQLTGKGSDPVVSGTISVDKFFYGEDVELSTVVANATRKKRDAETFTKRSKVVRFADLKVQLDGDVAVKNNLVTTQLQGDLSVLGDDAHPILRGEISAVQDGTRGNPKAHFRGNEFNIDDLKVSFNDTERITPYLDFHATTVNRDYKIALHAFGTPDDFNGPNQDRHFDLTSTPSLNKADIVTLLTLGFTSQDRSAGGNGAALGLGADVVSSITGLDQAASHFIPKNTLLRDPSVGVTSTYSQALGSMQPTIVVEGKLLVDALHMRLQEPVVTGGRGLRMQGEYRFNDASSVQVMLDRDNSDYNFPDVGLDLKLRWEMK